MADDTYRNYGEDRIEGCDCYACRPLPTGDRFADMMRTRMYLCVKCGNKRCPHATNHKLECTGSNESGQAGSIYE
jgi:hypothetical protein